MTRKAFAHSMTETRRAPIPKINCSSSKAALNSDPTLSPPLEPYGFASSHCTPRTRAEPFGFFWSFRHGLVLELALASRRPRGLHHRHERRMGHLLRRLLLVLSSRTKRTEENRTATPTHNHTHPAQRALANFSLPSPLALDPGCPSMRTAEGLVHLLHLDCIPRLAQSLSLTEADMSRRRRERCRSDGRGGRGRGTWRGRRAGLHEGGWRRRSAGLDDGREFLGTSFSQRVSCCCCRLSNPASLPTFLYLQSALSPLPPALLTR